MDKLEQLKEKFSHNPEWGSPPDRYDEFMESLEDILDEGGPSVLRPLWLFRKYDTTEFHHEMEPLIELTCVYFPDDIWVAEFVDSMQELLALGTYRLIDYILHLILRTEEAFPIFLERIATASVTVISP